MVRGMATIAKRDQVRRFIDSTSGTRNQVMNVGLALGTRVTARPANMAVASKYNIANFTPSMVLLSGRIVERWLGHLRSPRRVGSAIETRDQ
jgi:hypothetical protein